MKPILYIKKGCPWCVDALNYFQAKGLDLDIRDVRVSAEDMAELQKVSGQTLTPTLRYSDFIVADFDINEFETAIDKHPSVKASMGL
jgi:glutaredoxin